MKKGMKDTKNFIGIGVTTAVGQKVITSAGGGNYMGGAASMMPTLGTTMGAGMVLRQTQKLLPKKKR